MGPGEEPGDFDSGEDYADYFLEEEAGAYKFAVNDKTYIGSKGHTFWMMKEPSELSFNQLEVELTKHSGYSGAGYGVIFCQTDIEVGEKAYLMVLLGIEGEYCVGKLVHNRFSYLCPWESHDSIIKGYGRPNELLVKRLSSDSYGLWINGDAVVEFSDRDAPFTDGGGWGFVVVVSPRDKFPQVPVKVDFVVN